MPRARLTLVSVFLLALALPVCCQSPQVVSCDDKNFEGSSFSSSSEVLALVNETGTSHYSVHFAVTPDGPPLQPELASFSRGSGTRLTLELFGQLPPQIPAGSDFYLVVLAHADSGSSQTQGTALKCHDKAVPTQRAGGLAFDDMDWRPNLLGGKITIHRAAVETDLESYVVYTAVNETMTSGTLSWRMLRQLGEVPKHVVVVTAEASDVCRCAVVAQDQVCRGPSSLLGGNTSAAECAKSCDELAQCRFFVAGRAGSQREGRCYINGGDCDDLDAAANYDVFNLTSGTVHVYGPGPPEACHCGLVPGTLHRSLPAQAPSITIPMGTPVEGATHLIVVTKNSDGEMTLSSQLEKWVSTPLRDLALQVEPPTDLTFEDLDANQGILRGVVQFSSPVDADGVEYNVYLAGGANVQPLALTNPQSVRTFNGSNLLEVFLGAACPYNQSVANGQGACVFGEEELEEPSSSVNATSNSSNASSGSNVSNASEISMNRTCGSCAVAASATHLLVVPVGSGEEVRDLRRSVKLVDRTGRPPNSEIRGINFVDRDENPNLVGGAVQISVAQPEPKDIAAYRLYFQSEDSQAVSQVLRGGRAAWLGEVTATGFDVEIAFAHGTIIPPGVVRLAVKAVNADGEGPLARGITLRDIGSGSPEFHPPVVEVAITLGALVLICLCTCGWLLLRTKLRAFLVKIWETQTRRNSQTGEIEAATDGRSLGRASEVGLA